jgi:hypothetical protein
MVDVVPITQEEFVDTYDSMYPNAVTNVFNVEGPYGSEEGEVTNGELLYYTFSNIIIWREYVNKDFEHYLNENFVYDDDDEGEIHHYKMLWLFYKFPVEDFNARMQTLILEKNDINLTEADYALLLYASCQEHELFKDIPLPMLHDIFGPLAEKNVKEWMIIEE